MPIDARKDRRLLRAVMESRYELAELSRRFHVPLHELAVWSRQPATRRTIRAALELGGLQTQMLANRYRTAVVTKLLRVATGEGDAKPDIIRRACADLLALDTAPPTDPPAEKRLYPTLAEAEAARFAEMMGVAPAV